MPSSTTELIKGKLDIVDITLAEGESIGMELIYRWHSRDKSMYGHKCTRNLVLILQASQPTLVVFTLHAHAYIAVIVLCFFFSLSYLFFCFSILFSDLFVNQ